MPVLAVSPAAISRRRLALGRKSAPTAGDTGAAATVSVVAAPEARSSVAVTVAAPPASAMDAGVSASVACGVGSSSPIVPVPVGVPVAFVGRRSVTLIVSSGSSMVSPVTSTEMLRLVVPAGNVSVPGTIAV